jgi:calcineurin-like phosphoesterase family protein
MIEKQKGIEFMNIDADTYIIADTHFGHENILKHEPIRKKMLGNNPDERMVELWNEQVGGTDTVFHLGDFAWKGDTVQTYAARLNGVKCLLRGNHDKGRDVYLENGFSDVIDFSQKGEAAYFIAEVEGKKILFSHYPIVSDGYDDVHWRTLLKVFEKEQCDINIHGHVHSMKLGDARCINVSVEAIGFRPVKLGELL